SSFQAAAGIRVRDVIGVQTWALPILAFNNLTDTGRTTDTIPVTTDNAFDLSLSGQEAGTDVTYQVSLNGGAFGTTTASQSGLVELGRASRRVGTDGAGDCSTTWESSE